MISLLLNLLWLVFGGLALALGWCVAGVLMAVSVIGIPWAFAAFRIAGYALWPFGRIAEPAPPSPPGGFFTTFGNIIWFVFAGWWLALGHIVTAAAWAVTIIGLPFAWAHVKLAGLSLWPLGMRINTV